MLYTGCISKCFRSMTTLKSKNINNFKTFHMMCIICVTKLASTFHIYIYIYITFIVTLVKLV